MRPEEIIAEAKRATAAGDIVGALNRFLEADLASLDTMPAVRAMLHMARCTTSLGLRDSNREYHLLALERLLQSGMLDPPRLTFETAGLALNLAVGAHSPDLAKKYLQMMFGAMPLLDTGFRISPVAPLDARRNRPEIRFVPLELPQAFSCDDGQGRHQNLTYVSEATWHATIPNAEIVGGWDFPIAASGEALAGANYTPIEKALPFMPHAYCETAPAVGHVWPSDVIRVDADVLFLGTPERHHYGHWLSEFLPRLRPWDRSEFAIAISAGLPKKHRDLLARFGVDDDDLTECEIGGRYAFRNLQIVRSSRAHAPIPQDVGFLADGLAPGAGPLGSEILFLERDAGTRRPANTAELDAVLDAFGVRRVNPARLSLGDQIELLANTRAIIGAFGTEMFCLYNLRPGASVIELSWDARAATYYGPPCKMLGLNHHLILCAKSDNRGAATYRKDGDIVVDCVKLRDVLASV